ncbi:hypothetical protein CI109_100392 [Kwoniella shandongensis]|uniref:Uncharacterized protein n=1 Tax=Kwoniella shandongensis TaxID=1734106 RepID=A0A5M6C8T8_9TREE|nr:uncharacterized protein CI109_001765 [Kwoniella shandongensis]KAA5529825.1 hypothetical protein CI109_001765 [Kwoniella shandongensis]
MSSFPKAPRRSARLSTISRSTVDPDDDHDEEGTNPPPTKKKRGRPRKTSGAEQGERTLMVKREPGIEVDNKPDISSLASYTPELPIAGSSSSALAQTRPATEVKAEPGVLADIKPIIPSSSTRPIASSSTTTTPVLTVKPPKKRGRPSKADLVARAAQPTASTSTPSVKTEIDPAPNIGPSEVKVEPIASGSRVEAKAKVLDKAKGKSKEKAVADLKKQRLARVRAKCPATILARYQRAISQRMFMLEREKTGPVDLAETFKVLGSTGNVYTVNIGTLPRCDCPDCKKGNMPCKHIIFVFIKVLKVPDDSAAWYQKCLTHDELEELFGNAPPTLSGSVAVSAQVQQAYYQATGKGKAVETAVAEVEREVTNGPGSKKLDAIGDDCPVCYEEMTQEDEDAKQLTYDVSLVGCGRPLHTQCFEMWAMTARRAQNPVTCVWCRADWPSANGNGKGKGKGKATNSWFSGGYINMADVAGMSRQRDVSTYHRGYRYIDEDYAY